MTDATTDRIKGTFIGDYPVTDLKLHPKNPRVGDVSAIAESLTKHGQARPIVIDENGVIIAGNHTFKAAQQVGWTSIDVYQMPYDYDQALSFLVADNRLGDLGGYNDEALLDALNHLMETDNLAGTGYTADDIDDIAAQVSGVAEAEPGSGEHAHSEDDTRAHYGGQGTEAEGGDWDAGGEREAIKAVVLDLPVADYDLFEKATAKLMKQWGVASVRGAVLEAVLRQSGMKNADPEGDDD